MAVTINASLSAGLVQTADTSGIINLQSGGTTVATISSTGLTSTGGALNGTLGATTPSTVVATTGSFSNGVAITGGPLGYGGGELNLGSNTVSTGIFDTGTGSPVMYFDHRGAANTGLWRWRNNGTSTTPMQLDASGNLYLPGMSPGGTTNMHWSSANGQLFHVTSALKYKHDVRDVEDIDLSLLRPVRYKSKNKEVDGDGDFFGFIADEAHEKGLVELVTYRDGEVDSFKYDRVTPLLWKIAQQQQALITSLTARLELLEAK